MSGSHRRRNRTQKVRDRTRPSIRNRHNSQSAIGPIRQVSLNKSCFSSSLLGSSYLDIFIGEYSFKTVLAELARCLSLFPNLHTVQIDLVSSFRRRRSLEIFEQTFKDYSYPQIRNVFVMFNSASFIASCPQARRVGSTQTYALSRLCLQTIRSNCPHLEVLENFGDVFWTPNACDRALPISISLSA